MISNTLAATLLAAAVSRVAAQTTATYTPLTDRHYQYPGQIPYKVDTDGGDRGPQFGYALCNSTTQNQNSDCQLAMLNHIDDFCLWGPPNPNSLIGDEEAETVAWCTKSGWGTRIMPGGTLTGVQVLNAPGYVLFAGTLNQQNINIQAGDYGGELDPHGADERGNPLGGLVYSNTIATGNTNNQSFTQVIEWHNFMGSDIFCFKICRPDVANSREYCNNIFDRTGCDFVAPAAYQTGVFEVCDSDNQDPVGVYTSNGQVLTYSQPPEGVDITSLPSVKTPASSNCVTYNSANIYTDGNSLSASPGGSSTTAAPSGTTTTPVGGISTTPLGGASLTSSSLPSSTSNAASVPVKMASAGSGVAGLVAVVISIVAGFGAVVVGL